VADRRLAPEAVFYDPSLFDTTPPSLGSEVVCDERLRQGNRDALRPQRDPCDRRDGGEGVGLLPSNDGLRSLGGEVSVNTLETVVEGTLLVQYGVPRGYETTLSVIHSFGHGLTRVFDVHQGVAHGSVAPDVLRYISGEVDGRREPLAVALGVGDAPAQRLSCLW